MTVKDFQGLISNVLSKQKEIIHILDSDTSLLVSCENDSCFYVNILESKQAFIHDSHEEKRKDEYLSTHSKEDFAEDILKLSVCHPGFFIYFLMLSKLQEMQIIDNGLFFHIMDCIVCDEHEIDNFISRIKK